MRDISISKSISNVTKLRCNAETIHTAAVQEPTVIRKRQIKKEVWVLQRREIRQALRWSWCRTHAFLNKNFSMDQPSCFLLTIGVLYCSWGYARAFDYTCTNTPFSPYQQSQHCLVNSTSAFSILSLFVCSLFSTLQAHPSLNVHLGEAPKILAKALRLGGTHVQLADLNLGWGGGPAHRSISSFVFCRFCPGRSMGYILSANHPVSISIILGCRLIDQFLLVLVF